MTTATMGRWGNANALRIPLPFCEQLGITVGSNVSMTIKDRCLVIEPTDEDYTLQGRLKNWDGKRYETSEYEWGESQGDELW